MGSNKHECKAQPLGTKLGNAEQTSKAFKCFQLFAASDGFARAFGCQHVGETSSS